MRFAGDLIRQGNPNDTISPQSADEVYRFQQQLRDKPIVPSFNAEDLEMTPEMKPGQYFPGQDLMRDKYIRQDPGSGVARLPGGEQGPVRGPHTPIKNYGGKYMPDGSAGSGGFMPGPVRQASIDGQEVALGGVGVAAGVIGGLKLLQSAQMGLSGGAVNPGTIHDYANQDPTNQYNRHKQDADDNYMEIMKSGFI